jgi:alpha-methylacyl-CoA racemase
MGGPLRGVKILEFASIGPGPYAAMLMADLGADILRLERVGDASSRGTANDLLNRSRPSIGVDLKSDAGRMLVLRLTEKADAVVEGFRPGVMERLGLGPDDLLSRNRALVYGRMTGYGQSGPLAQRAGHDINYIAVSGALWPLGRAGERPTPPMNLVGDFGGGGLFLVMGVLAAIISARSTGQGQVVDAAMVDGSASMLTMMHSFLNLEYWQEERGVNILDTGAHFYEVYETSDEKYVAVGAVEAKFYAELLRGLGLDATELPAQMDRAQWPAMKVRFADLFATKSRDEWAEIFGDVDACVSPVLSPREAAHHPWNTERGVFALEPVIQPQPAPRFSLTPGSIGESHAMDFPTDQLRDWGLSVEDLETLRDIAAIN